MICRLLVSYSHDVTPYLILQVPEQVAVQGYQEEEGEVLEAVQVLQAAAVEEEQVLEAVQAVQAVVQAEQEEQQGEEEQASQLEEEEVQVEVLVPVPAAAAEEEEEEEEEEQVLEAVQAVQAAEEDVQVELAYYVSVGYLDVASYDTFANFRKVQSARFDISLREKL